MSSPDPDPFAMPAYPSFGDASFGDATSGFTDATAHPPAPVPASDATFAPSPVTSWPAPAGQPWDAPAAVVIPRQPGPAPSAPWSTPAVPRPPVGPAPVAKRRVGFNRGTATGAAAGAGLLGKLLLSGKALLVLTHFPVLASMAVSVAAYAYFWGWNFAIGFVLLMFAHEMGHVIVLRRQGIPATAPMFIPFLGAFVRMKGAPRSVAAEAVSALAGPAVGVLASGLVLLAGDAYHLPLLVALAYTGCLLNLFNLIPMLPLDGGRVAGALHPAVWFIGLAGVIGLAILRPSIVYLFVIALGGAELVRRWRAHRAGTDAAYMTIPTATRWKIGLGYLAVLSLCVAGMLVTYRAARP